MLSYLGKENTSNEQNIRSYHMLNHQNKGLIIPVLLHFRVFWLIVFKTHPTGAKDKNQPNEVFFVNIKIL